MRYIVCLVVTLAMPAAAQQPGQAQTEAFIADIAEDRPRTSSHITESYDLAFDGPRMSMTWDYDNSRVGTSDTVTSADLRDFDLVRLRTSDNDDHWRYGCRANYATLHCRSGDCVRSRERRTYYDGDPSVTEEQSLDTMWIAFTCDGDFRPIRRVGNALQHLGRIHGVDITVSDELYDRESIGSAFD
ncbi:MAG: hypothetical protein ACPGID_00875 [Rubricella sp.]